VIPFRDRAQTLGEEIANSISHGIGLLAGVAATPLLVLSAARDGGLATVVGASVFATTIVLLYSASTLYHALPPNRAKRVFRALDHGAIFLLIAGTYTPFALGILRGAWGWTLLSLVWTLALVGIVLKAIGALRNPTLSTTLYLVMGWLALIVVRPVWLRMPAAGLVWLLAGGLAYTTGVAFFTAPRLRYSHFIWHLFVLAGTACHFCAVLWYAD
jgi:hemolysin III